MNQQNHTISILPYHRVCSKCKRALYRLEGNQEEKEIEKIMHNLDEPVRLVVDEQASEKKNENPQIGEETKHHIHTIMELSGKANQLLIDRVQDIQLKEVEEINNSNDITSALHRLAAAMAELEEEFKIQRDTNKEKSREIDAMRLQIQAAGQARAQEMKELREIKQALVAAQKQTSKQRILRTRERQPKATKFQSFEEEIDYYYYRHIVDAISLKKWDITQGRVTSKHLKKAKKRWIERVEKVLTKVKNGHRVDYVPFKDYLSKLLRDETIPTTNNKITIKISGDGRSLGRRSSLVLSISFLQHPRPQCDVSRSNYIRFIQPNSNSNLIIQITQLIEK